MTRTRKTLTFFGALAFIVIASWALIGGALYALGGVMTVEIEDHDSGRDLHLPLPMALLEIVSIPVGAIHPFAVASDDIHLELKRFGPVLVEMLESLDEMPDATLVEVWDGAEHVRVSKDGGKLRVVVTERDKSIQFSVPTRSVARIADRILGI